MCNIPGVFGGEAARLLIERTARQPVGQAKPAVLLARGCSRFSFFFVRVPTFFDHNLRTRKRLVIIFPFVFSVGVRVFCMPACGGMSLFDERRISCSAEVAVFACIANQLASRAPPESMPPRGDSTVW